MIVELSCPDGSNTKEWFIIELQGLIEPRINDGSINGHAAGDISLQPGGKRATLLLGNHRMAGTIQKLTKPLIVTSTVKSDEQSGQALAVRAIVRHKILFVERPQPVISAANKAR